MGSQCCVEEPAITGFEPISLTFQKYPPPFQKTNIVSHSSPPYTMIVTRTSMPNKNDHSDGDND